MCTFSSWNVNPSQAHKAAEAAYAVINTVCAVQKDERVVIVTNPVEDTARISMLLYDAALEVGAKPSLIFQPVKTLLDTAEDTVLSALAAEPQVFFSISHNKLGKDSQLIANPIIMPDGARYDSRFDYNLNGKKCMRAVWTPGITLDMFARSALIDYTVLEKRCADLKQILNGSVRVRVTAPGGTDVTIETTGRQAKSDDGRFTTAGTGGNIPAGEVFVSPVVGKTQGIIVFDGSMSLKNDDVLICEPICCTVCDGYVTEINGGAEAKLLLQTITDAETASVQMEREGKLPALMGEIYKKNSRNIGELGIGLNPAAIISGNMLEDEKAFKTCHFAIGANYDDDAPSLIHLDGVVKEPTITVYYSGGSECIILKNGSICV